MMPILFGVDMPLLGVGAHELDGLERVVHAVGLRFIAVAAQAVAQDDGGDAVVLEEIDLVRALTADVQRAVAAARGENDGGAGVELAVAGVEFDRGIVDADDVADRLAAGAVPVVDLGFADLVVVQVRRVGRIKRHNHAAGQDRLRGVGRVGFRTGRRHAQRRGQRRQRGLGGGIGRDERIQGGQQAERGHAAEQELHGDFVEG